MQAGKFARLVKREGLCAVRYIGQNGEDGVYLAPDLQSSGMTGSRPSKAGRSWPLCWT